MNLRVNLLRSLSWKTWSTGRAADMEDRLREGRPDPLSSYSHSELQELTVSLYRRDIQYCVAG